MNTIRKFKHQQTCQSSLATNIQKFMHDRRINEAELSRQTQIPQPTLHKILTGKTDNPKLDTLQALSAFFDTTIDSLATEPLSLALDSHCSNVKPLFIPILDWDSIKHTKPIQSLDLSKWKDWQPVSYKSDEKISNQAFALKSLPSMYPRFPYGTTFIFDPKITPQDGDIALIRFLKSNEIAIKELRIDPPEYKLYSITSGANPLDFSKKEHDIIAVNILTIISSHRC